MVDIGQKVLIRYRGMLDDGSVFDGDRGEPVELVVGSQKMLPAFEKAVSEMEPGERRTVRIPSEQAYGAYDENLIVPVAAKRVRGAEKLGIGAALSIAGPAGPIRAKVWGFEGDSVLIDCNHELAGRDLTYDVELVRIVADSAIERELHPAGCACGCHRLKESLAS